MPNAFYKITHPYGVGVSTNMTVNGSAAVYLQADATGAINVADNDGCGAVILPPCHFAAVMTPEIPVGPWLVWDTYGSAPPLGPPVGFIGDAVTPHRVAGSPFGTNYFKIEQLQRNGSLRLSAFTDPTQP